MPPVKKKRRRSPWDAEGSMLNREASRTTLEELLQFQEAARPRQAACPKAIRMKGLFAFDPVFVTREDVRQFLWAGLRELRLLAKAKGWEEEEVQRLLVSAFDVLHDASASIWAAMKAIASSMRTEGTGGPATFTSESPFVLLAPQAESPPSVAVACVPERGSAGSGNGEGEKKTSLPSEHPAWEGLNRAHFLQAEQVRSYRARRDADLDELEDA